MGKILPAAICITILIISQVIPNPIQLPWQILLGSNPQFDSALLITVAGLVGALPFLNLADVQTFDQYQYFADRTNDATKILNDRLHFQTPALLGTQIEYSEISKVITNFVLPIGAYNDMVLSAQNLVTTYTTQHILDQNLLNEFYTKIGIFSVQLVLIATSPYSSISYDLVGALYRSTGLQVLAFKCPSCISVILSNANSFVRSSFVGATTYVAENALNEVYQRIDKQSIS